MWFKNQANMFNEFGVTPIKVAKRGQVDFLENCICGDKNILALDCGVITFRTYILMSLVKKV